VYIEELIARVVEIARAEVRSGKISERQLARLTGLSQPHLHNSLNGVRTFSPKAAGKLMRALKVTVPDVIWRLPERDAWTPAPLLRSRVGPGAEANFSSFDGFAPFPTTVVSGLVNPVAVRLAPDSVLPDDYQADDLVLLDQNPDLRRDPPPGWCWVTSVFGGQRVRYVRVEGSRLWAGHRANRTQPEKWESISLRGQNILNVVRARIVWIGRKMEKAPGGSFGSPRAGY
jgi:hypothetical protein